MSNRDICLCGQMFSAHNKNFCITNVNGNEDKMSTFKNIEKLGLKIIDLKGIPYCVDALALEDILQSAQVVYGPDKRYWNDMKEAGDNYSAILLAITPIKKKTKAEAALELLQEMSKIQGYENWYTSAAKRILEMKDSE